VWSELDMDLLRESEHTVYSCVYMGDNDLWVIDAKAIVSIVAMIPMRPLDGSQSERFFLMEKPGLAITQLRDVSGTTVESDK
jgi:hypothetical protein